MAPVQVQRTRHGPEALVLEMGNQFRNCVAIESLGSIGHHKDVTTRRAYSGI